MEIKDLIREKRQELGLTYEQLGELVGVGKSTVRKWETGMIENMRRDNIIALSKALNISPALLMGWDFSKTEINTSNNYSKEEHQHIEDLRKLNDIGKNKVITYTKDLMDNPKFINEPIQNQSEDEISSTSLDDFEPYLLAAHSDGLDEETNKANIEKIKKMYLEIKGK